MFYKFTVSKQNRAIDSNFHVFWIDQDKLINRPSSPASYWQNSVKVVLFPALIDSLQHRMSHNGGYLNFSRPFPVDIQLYRLSVQLSIASRRRLDCN